MPQHQLQDQPKPAEFAGHETEFDNLESVESVYTEDVIEQIDVADVSQSGAEAANDADYHFEPETQSEQADTDASIYSLNDARLMKQSKRVERRANKAQLTDRRSAPRYTASGELQPDRRAANQLVNLNAMKPNPEE